MASVGVDIIPRSTYSSELISVNKGESCPCELEFITGLAQATVSHHLTILEDAGLIFRSRKGKWTILKSEKQAIVETFFAL